MVVTSVLGQVARGVANPALGEGGGYVPPAWVPGTAVDSIYLDFVNDRYFSGRTAYASLALYFSGAGTTLTRSSTKNYQDTTGALTSVAVDTLARGNRGALIEAAMTPLIDNSELFSSADWNKDNCTTALVSTWWETKDTNTGGSAVHRRLHRAGGAGVALDVTNGVTYTSSALVQKRNRRYAYFRGNIRSSGSNENVGFDLDASSGAGSVTFAATGWTGRITRFGTDIYLIEAVVTATGSFSTGQIGFGWDDGSIGDNTLPTYATTDDVTVQAAIKYFQIEQGSKATSYRNAPDGAITSRSADVFTIHLPSGTHDLTFTFVDDTTQTVTGLSGNYAVPTNLNGAFIKTVSGLRVSPLP